MPLHPDAVVVDQALTPGSRRSNLATYSGMANAIRKAFATANKVQPALFSANSKGACPACEGLGVIYTDLQHMDPVATRCEACVQVWSPAPVFQTNPPILAHLDPNTNPIDRSIGLKNWPKFGDAMLL